MRILLLKILLLLLISCNSNNSIDDGWTPSLSIEPSELHAKQGDCFIFKDSLNRYFLGTLMNFHKSDDGILYAMCFNNYYDSIKPKAISTDSIQFCGRKVMNSTPEQYNIGFDITWVRDTVVDINNKGILGNIELSSIQNNEIVAEGNAMNFKEFSQYFHLSKNERQLPPDNYWDLTKEHLRTDEYFTLKQIADQHKNSVRN